MSPRSDGRASGQGAHQLIGHPFHVALGDGAVDQAPLCRLGSAHPSRPSSSIWRGSGQADRPWKQPGGPAVRGEAPGRERLPEAGVVGRHREVGRRGDLHADARGPPLDGTHHRYLHLYRGGGGVDGPGKAGVAGWHPLVGRRCSPAVAGHDVGTAAEVVAAAADLDDPNSLVVFRRRPPLVDKPGHHDVADGVALFGAVEPQPQARRHPPRPPSRPRKR